MPEPDVKRLKEFGDEIHKRFSMPLASKSSKGKKNVMDFERKMHINQLVLMENIEFGERVREFTIYGNTVAGWKGLCKGSCIGHKYIARFEGVEVSSLRLEITRSLGEPQIREFSAYHLETNEVN